MNPFDSRGVPNHRINSSMDEHTSPVTEDEAHHLLSRLTYGATIDRLAESVGLTAGEIVDQLLDEAEAPLPPAPSWITVQRPPRGAPSEDFTAFNASNRTWRDELRTSWIQDMAENGLRGRLALFWHNHFVTSYVVYSYAAMGYHYLKTLQTHSTGNFKDFVHAVGRDSAMLVYLDGDTNRASAPNENYARELLELFTMSPVGPDGSPNYTEDDIQEISRAMTGWRITPSSTWFSYMLFTRYDDGDKTIFGQTSDFNYNEVIDLIFQERATQIAHFIAEKLYCEFIYQDPDPEAIADLAQSFVDSEFELRPVLRKLFTSQRFLDQNFAGSRVKSPVEFLLGHFREIDILPTEDQAEEIWRGAAEMGQSIFDPPNVAGWPGQRYWLSTDTLPKRWSSSEYLSSRSISRVYLINFSENLVGQANIYAGVDLPVALAKHFLKVPIDWVEVPNISEPFEGDLDANPLPEWLVNGPENQRNLVKLFLGSVPWYEYSIRTGVGHVMIANFLTKLSQFPEYQLI